MGKIELKINLSLFSAKYITTKRLWKTKACSSNCTIKIIFMLIFYKEINNSWETVVYTLCDLFGYLVQ